MDRKYTAQLGDYQIQRIRSTELLNFGCYDRLDIWLGTGETRNACRILVVKWEDNSDKVLRERVVKI
jgi:hypothetical protein